MKDWSSFYEKTKSNPPQPLLVEADRHVIERHHAFDLGAGALVDSRFLLEQGYTVDAMDRSEDSLTLSKFIQSDRFNFIHTTFQKLQFPRDHYNLISAQWTLPFIGNWEDLQDFFTKVKQHLAKGGVFTGQFFGTNDDWSDSEKIITISQEQLDTLLSDLHIIKLEEREYDGILVNGNKKHWHVFNVIATNQT